MEIIKSDNDFFTSVEKALDEIHPQWKKFEGVLIVGTHTPKDIDEKVSALALARVAGIPALGICFGMQLMAIEYAKNALDMKDAMSEEYALIGTPVISKLPRLHVGIDKVAGWWGTTDESHWHNYSFNTAFSKKFEEEWELSDSDGIIEIMRLKQHPFYVGVQFHPEYQSSKTAPHPVLRDFINVCRK